MPSPTAVRQSRRQDRRIGAAARRSLEAELGAKVHLDLQVGVRGRWRRDEGLLARLGTEYCADWWLGRNLSSLSDKKAGWVIKDSLLTRWDLSSRISSLVRIRLELAPPPL